MLALFARARTHMQQPAKKVPRRKVIFLQGLPRHIPPLVALLRRPSYTYAYTYSRKQGLPPPPPPPRGEVERFIGCRFMPERVAIQGYKRGEKGSWKRSGVGSLLSFLSGKVTLEKGGRASRGENPQGRKEEKRGVAATEEGGAGHSYCYLAVRVGGCGVISVAATEERVRSHSQEKNSRMQDERVQQKRCKKNSEQRPTHTRGRPFPSFPPNRSIGLSYSRLSSPPLRLSPHLPSGGKGRAGREGRRRPNPSISLCRAEH